MTRFFGVTAGGRWWQRTRVLRSVAVVTLPLFILYWIYFLSALSDYAWIRQFEDFWSIRPSFRRVLYGKIAGAAHSLDATQLKQSMDFTDRSHPIMRLDVNSADWNRLSQDFTEGFTKFIDAHVVRDAGHD